jgi:hypothetical protein
MGCSSENHGLYRLAFSIGYNANVRTVAQRRKEAGPTDSASVGSLQNPQPVSCKTLHISPLAQANTADKPKGIHQGNSAKCPISVSDLREWRWCSKATQHLQLSVFCSGQPLATNLAVYCCDAGHLFIHFHRPESGWGPRVQQESNSYGAPVGNTHRCRRLRDVCRAGTATCACPSPLALPPGRVTKHQSDRALGTDGNHVGGEAVYSCRFHTTEQ